ncbi:DUF6293 family protein [Halobacterium salinarum]|uniref:HFX_2341 family transcriptional regulator domain-containing protein n=1 Tax=Halobacterium salinarum TaxID=2242 RepID=UPI002553522F|nr:DUF6293 family protein [Halobacterium salinarum]MDL0126341.1 DUF6293 family protein [Halobacterium salinarum]
MDIADRVQIAPLGYEYNRILEPIYEYNADIVVLLRHQASQDYEASFQRDLVQTLRENDRIELKERECDLFDINNAVTTFVNVIEAHQKDDVLVNLSTGSKLTAIGGMMACQSTSATPFYVAPNFRNEDGGREAPSEPLTDSVGEMFDLPVFRLSSPSPDQLTILGYLREQNGATKKELIQHARDEELTFITDTSSKTEEGLYRLLDTRIIKPLCEQSYIHIEKDGRKKRVYLDDHGQDALRIFPSPESE